MPSRKTSAPTLTPSDRRAVARLARCELARRGFWDYCKLRDPKFYADGREYLRHLCDELEATLTSDERVTVIQAPPRHGKSRTAQLFVEWRFGRDKTLQIMTGSYNETLSKTFAKGVRDAIAEIPLGGRLTFQDVFPGVDIRKGDAAMNLWALDESGNGYSYLATSPTGTATGFGCDLMIIDDLIKNKADAYNDRILDSHWSWFTDTMLSRLEEGGRIIIVGTRWVTGDLIGRVLKQLPERGYAVREVRFTAVQDDGSMLCPDILSAESYAFKKSMTAPEIISANFMQEPIDLIGRLYTGFLEYEAIPDAIEYIAGYCDTADEGEDYLSAMVFAKGPDGDMFMIDAVYSQAPMDVTVYEVADMIARTQPALFMVEGNNGGTGFARDLKRILANRSPRTSVQWYHNSKNKKSRILSNAYFANTRVHMPRGWADSYPLLFGALMTYQREGKNAHDDAPDCLTGCIEMATAPLKSPTVRVTTRPDYSKARKFNTL